VVAGPDDDCRIGNVNLDVLQPYADNIIWNFGQCKKDLWFEGTDGTGMGIWGLVLPPYADVHATGRIDGQVFVKSFNSTAQINMLHFDCLNNTQQTPCQQEYVDVFGCAESFNVFVKQDYHGGSDVQGRLAAGGTVSFDNGFSVGDQLFSKFWKLDVSRFICA